MVLNVLTIVALKRHNASTHGVSSKDEETKKQRERQLTITILSASISYVSLSFLSVLNNILSSVYVTYYAGGRYW